jgi:hypothetical protein
VLGENPYHIVPGRLPMPLDPLRTHTTQHNGMDQRMLVEFLTRHLG